MKINNAISDTRYSVVHIAVGFADVIPLPKGETTMANKNGLSEHNGRWRARFTFDGKRYEFTQRERETKKDFEQRVRDNRYKIENCMAVKVNNRMTVDQWFDTFMDVYKVDVKVSTRDSYKSMYVNKVKPVFGTMKMVNVKSVTLQRFFNELAKEYALNSVKLCYALMSTMFKTAYRQDVIAVNPFDKVDAPKQSKIPQRVKAVLSQEDIQLFLQYAGDHPYSRVIQFELLTGMRNGEVSALTWDDIDLVKGVVNVRYNLIHDKETGCNVVSSTKSKKERQVYLTETACSLLKKQRYYQNERWLSSGGEYNRGKNRVFLSVKGHDLKTNNLDQWIYSVLNRLEKDGYTFPHISAHSLRHTFATYAREQDVSIEVLQAWLGHADVTTTLKHYVHTSDTVKAREMVKMEGIL